MKGDDDKSGVTTTKPITKTVKSSDKDASGGIGVGLGLRAGTSAVSKIKAAIEEEPPTTNWSDPQWGFDKMGTISVEDIDTKKVSQMPREDFLKFGDDDMNDMFMNSLNGQYKVALSHIKADEDDPATLKGSSKALGLTSWQLAKLSKSASSDEDFAKIDELRKQFLEQSRAFQDVVRVKGGDFDIGFVPSDSGPSSWKLMDSEKIPEISQQMIIESTLHGADKDKYSTDIVSEDYTSLWGMAWKSSLTASFPFAVEKIWEGGIPTHTEDITDPKRTFNKIKTTKGEMKEQLNKNAMTPIINSWLDFGFGNYTKSDFGGGATSSFNNKELIKNLSIAGLEHIQKWGMNDPSTSTAAKSKAAELLEGLNKLPANNESRQKFIYENRRDIKKLIGGMGYYGKKNLMNKYSDDFNSDYYSTTNGENEKIAWDNIYKNLLKDQDQSDEVFDRLKEKAVAEFLLKTKSGYSVPKQMIRRTMFDEAGGLLEFSDVLAKFRKEGKTHPSTRRGYTGTMYESNYREPTKRIPSGGYGGEGPSYRSPGETVGGNIAAYTWADMKDAYDEMRDEYQIDYNDLSPHEIFIESTRTLGLGRNRSTLVGHNNVKLHEDDNGGKSSNFKTIANLIKESVQDGGTGYVALGEYSQNIQEADLEKISSEDKQKAVKKLFNMDNRLGFDVRFARLSSIPGKSAYVVTTKGKKPTSFTFYVDTKAAEAAKEQYAVESYDTPQDWAYKLSGGWDISGWNGKYKASKDYKIIDKHGAKYLMMKTLNVKEPAMGYEDYELFLGANALVDIERAMDISKSILKEWDDLNADKFTVE